VEIVSRLRASDVSPATLDALRVTADRPCTEYPYVSWEQLAVEDHAWLRRITAQLDRRLTLTQQQEVLALAGTVPATRYAWFANTCERGGSRWPTLTLPTGAEDRNNL
jgi:hypothetical protein